MSKRFLRRDEPYKVSGYTYSIGVHLGVHFWSTKVQGWVGQIQFVVARFKRTTYVTF